MVRVFLRVPPYFSRTGDEIGLGNACIEAPSSSPELIVYHTWCVHAWEHLRASLAFIASHACCVHAWECPRASPVLIASLAWYVYF